MRKPYRDIDEMLSLSLRLIKSFNAKEQRKIKRWYGLCLDNPLHYTPFALQNLLYECFWDIPEAIDMGFLKYYNKELLSYKELLNYHNINCIGKQCIICKDRKEMLNFLGVKNEREKPRIYAK